MWPCKSPECAGSTTHPNGYCPTCLASLPVKPWALADFRKSLSSSEQSCREIGDFSIAGLLSDLLSEFDKALAADRAELEAMAREWELFRDAAGTMLTVKHSPVVDLQAQRVEKFRHSRDAYRACAARLRKHLEGNDG